MQTDMVILVFDEDMETTVNVLLQQNDIEYYTIYRKVEGIGTKGLRNNTSIGPGYNITYMIFIDEINSKNLYNDIKRVKENNKDASIKYCSFEAKNYI